MTGGDVAREPQQTSPPRRVLMICYYYPPLGGVASMRAAKFSGYLPEFGWEPTVLAPSNGVYYRDETIAWDESRVRRAYAFDLSGSGKRLFRAADADAGQSEPASFVRAVRALVRRYVYRPDAQVGWLPLALRAGRSLVRRQPFDALFSSSFPVTCHLIARRLHRDHGVPWVAEFRDPWADAVAADEARRPRLQELERRLVEDAAAVVTVSPSWAQMFRSRGARHVEVITNGFDADDMPRSRPPRAPATVAHLGTLYPHMEDLRGVWEAVARLAQRWPPDRAPTLRFVGEIPASIQRQIETAGIDKRLEVTGFIPHGQALEAVSDASALLLGGGVGPSQALAGWIPAKLFEYLATGLPVIYVGRLDSDAAHLLRQQPLCYCLAPTDVAGIERALEDVAQGPRVQRALEPFTRRRLTGKLGALLDQIAIHRGTPAC